MNKIKLIFIFSIFLVFLEISLVRKQGIVLAQTLDGIYVTDFGAVGDGVTDDSAAFQKAANAAATEGKNLIIPSPTGPYYRVTNDTAVSVSVIGDGSYPMIKMDNPSGDWGDSIFKVQNYTGSGIMFKGLYLNGGWSETGFDSMEHSHAILISGSRNVTVDSNVLENNRGDGVYVGTSKPGGAGVKNQNILIQNNMLIENRRCGVAVISVDGIQILNNTFVKSNSFQTPIDVEPNPNGNDSVWNLTINGNNFYSPNSTPILLYHSKSWVIPEEGLGGGKYTIINNVGYGNSPFINVYPSSGVWPKINQNGNSWQSDTLAPTCSSFAYSPWTSRQSNSIQKRVVIGKFPAGCKSGNPLISRSYDPFSSLPTISSFTANPTSITSGKSTTLSWATSRANTLSIKGIGTVTGNRLTVSPTSTKTYTLTATNSSGSVTKNVTVKVNPVSQNSTRSNLNGAPIPGIGTGNTYIPKYVNVTGAGAFPDISNAVITARCLGLINATTCLQNAINSAADQGKPLLVPSGNYIITSPLKLKTSMIGIGNTQPILKTTTTGLDWDEPGYTTSKLGSILLVEASNLWIYNLHLIGTYNNDGSEPQEKGPNISLGNISNITIRGNVLDGAQGDSINDHHQTTMGSGSGGPQNILIDNNTMNDPGRCNISLVGKANGWAVINNIMTKSATTDSSIDLEPYRASWIEPYINNIEVSYNKVVRNDIAGIPFSMTSWTDNTPGGNVWVYSNYGSWPKATGPVAGVGTRVPTIDFSRNDPWRPNDWTNWHIYGDKNIECGKPDQSVRELNCGGAQGNSASGQQSTSTSATSPAQELVTKNPVLTTLYKVHRSLYQLRQFQLPPSLILPVHAALRMLPLPLRLELQIVLLSFVDDLQNFIYTNGN